LYRGITKIVMATASVADTASDVQGTEVVSATPSGKSEGEGGSCGEDGGGTGTTCGGAGASHDDATTNAQADGQQSVSGHPPSLSSSVNNEGGARSSARLAFDGGGGTEEDGAGDAGKNAELDAAQTAQDVIVKTSGLVARAAAAKEVDVKKLPGIREPSGGLAAPRARWHVAGSSIRVGSEGSKLSRRSRRTQFQDDADIDAAAADDDDMDMGD